MFETGGEGPIITGTSISGPELFKFGGEWSAISRRAVRPLRLVNRPTRPSRASSTRYTRAPGLLSDQENLKFHSCLRTTVAPRLLLLRHYYFAHLFYVLFILTFLMLLNTRLIVYSRSVWSEAITIVTPGGRLRLVHRRLQAARSIVAYDGQHKRS